LGEGKQSTSAAAAGVSALPAGFQDTTVFSGLTFPTNIRFASDGRVFVAEKSGLIKVFSSLAATTPTVVADLRTEVDDYWDRGLLGLALDPNFPSSPYIYALYTYDAPIGGTAPVWNDACPTPPGPTTDGCVVTGKLVRLQLSGNSVVNRTTLISGEWCQQYPSHSIGDLNFGPDGMLYVTGGDGSSFDFVDYGQGGGSSGSPTPKNPCGDPPAGVGGNEAPPTAEGGSLRSQSLRRAAGEPVLLNGALLRVDPATGAAAPGNPLASNPSANAQRIVAYGMRNPFRFTFRPGTNEIWIGDVGWDTWEEVNRLVNPTAAAGPTNFGWPCYEGKLVQSGYQSAGLNICSQLYSAGTAVQPYYTYNHSAAVVSGDGCSTANGSVISGIGFYNGDLYPSQYKGALFFGDHSRNCIWAMLPGTNGLPDPTNIQLFAGGAGNPVDIESGPNGDLFYVDFDGGAIHEITYGSSGGGGSCSTGTFDAQYFANMNLTGTPALDQCEPSINHDWGLGSPAPGIPADGFSVRWTGQFSFQGGSTTFTATADDGIRVYLDGNVLIDKWIDQPATTYTATTNVTTGIHTVKVEYYENGDEAVARTSWQTAAGSNAPPTPLIDSPQQTVTYAVGDAISFSGHASDAEDGTLPASALSWQLIVHHCTTPTDCHIHNIQSWSGVASGSFNAPDHDYPSFLELAFTATDSGGASSTTSVQLNPKTVNLTFASSPSGLSLAVGSSASTTPFTRTVIVNSINSISAPTPQTVSGTSYTFSSWSDGGAATHNITAPATDTTYTATYAAAGPVTCPCSLWGSGAQPQTAAVTEGTGYELGVRFKSDVAGYVSGIRFYKGTGNTGTHVGHLWSASGTQLAAATFTGESATGWQQVSFPSPVAIAASTTYVASYTDPAGHFALDRPYFTTGYDNPPLHALADGTGGVGNGVYAVGSGFPSNSYQASNYWVDVVFTTDLTDNSPPASTVTFPAASGSYGTAKWTAGCASAGFCGTASDSLSGVKRVELSVRQVSSGNYWTGTSFSATSEQFLAATGTSSWSFPFAASSFPADGQYVVRTRAVDNAGNVEAASSRTFTIDTALPGVAASFPAASGAYNAAAWAAGCATTGFCGSASDGGSGVQKVELSLKRVSTSRWWNGTTFGSTTEAWQAASGTGSWSYAFAGTSFPAQGQYTLLVRATDQAGNVTTTTGATFVYDATAPTTAVTFPAASGAYTTASWNAGCPSPGMCGTASDAGAGVQKVELSIRRGSANYWNGSSFGSATEVFFTATGTTAWSFAFPAANFPAKATYTIRVRATDNVGNLKAPTATKFSFTP
jgi:glucose/arabinose dehydrogenase